MNIAICCPFIARGMGGLERVGIDLANNMTRRGHNVALIHYDTAPPVYPVDPGVTIVDNLQDSEATIRRTAAFRPDVFLIMSSGFLSIYMAKIATALQCPFGIHESSMHFRFCGHNWARRRNCSFEEACLEREAINSIAARTRHILPHSVGFLPEYLRHNVRIFPNPVNYAVSKRAPAGRTSGGTIINIGGLKQVKNILPALQAFAAVAKDFPAWNMKIFGQGFAGEAEYQETIRRFIADNGLESPVLLMGNCLDIQNEYLKADIHVTASLVENYGMAVAEAMACGVPSIGFENSFGTSELISHMRDGLLVPQEDAPESMEKGFRLLMGDDTLRGDMSSNAAKNAARFSPDAIYRQWEQFFEEIHGYADTPERLLQEHLARDPERPLFARRKALALLEE